MTATNYAFQEYDEGTMSRAYGRALSISTKKSVEVCNWIKGKSLSSALKMLEDVVAMRKAVPYSRFNQELAHQRATGPGGFPINVAKNVILILKSAEANASAKGLNTSSLKIVHICAHLGSRPFRHGRKRRVKAKRTHIEVVLQEVASKSKSSKSSKSDSKKTDSKIKAPEKAPEKSQENVSEKVVEKAADKVADKPVENESVVTDNKESQEKKADEKPSKDLPQESSKESLKDEDKKEDVKSEANEPKVDAQ